jgi:hypothetical protein
MGEVREEQEVVPSQVDEDEWAEINRYQQMKQIKSLRDDKFKKL